MLRYPPWGISKLADFGPMGYISFHAVMVFGLGNYLRKNLLFKSVLGHCGEKANIMFDC
jgi:hypothetical protein